MCKITLSKKPFVIAFLALSLSCTQRPVKLTDLPEKKDTKMNSEKFEKTRAELIAKAKIEVVKKLGPIHFEDYPDISVWKSKNQIRVSFRTPVQFEEMSESKSETIHCQFIPSQPAIVYPKDKEFLYTQTDVTRKIASLFSPTDRIILSEKETFYTATVSHKGGGAEGYKIDKITWEKTMTWHEHPNPYSQDISIDGGDPEIEIKD